MTRQIYRKEALERLSSPEQLDQLMQLTSPRSWIGLGALGLLLVIGVAWSLFGTVSTTVEGQGVLRRYGGPIRLPAEAAGVVNEFKFKLGDSVAKDEVLVLLTPDGSGKPMPVRSKGPVRILRRFVKKGSRVKKGDPLLLLDPQDKRMGALLYLPVREGYQVQRGMRVLVSPAPAKKSEFGYLRGQVISAAKFPSTREDIQLFLENEEIAQQLTAAGPSLQVFVELTPAITPSGYEWTSAEGWPMELYSGIPCQALITVNQQRPIELVLPTLREMLGF